LKAAKKDVNRQRQSVPKTHPGVSGERAYQASVLLNLQRTVGNQAVQHLLAQRHSDQDGCELDADITARINRARAGGQPLDPVLQESMGQKMNYDFSPVRVHTDLEADALSRELGALAFTVCYDIFFKQGAYQPHTQTGKELIAHELTHVIQQTAGGACSIGSRLKVSEPNDASEQEAEAVAEAVTKDEVQTKLDDEEEST
jgi:hypothetical protein